MKKIARKIFISGIMALLICGLAAPVSFAAAAKTLKIGYVDLRRAFYEYKKSKDYNATLETMAGKSTEERNAKVEELKKIREESQLLSGKTREDKDKEIEIKINDLNNFDQGIRQEILNKKNDMFREVIDDIQKVVEKKGKDEGYDYIFDSRNIIYGSADYDMTEAVLKELNK